MSGPNSLNPPAITRVVPRSMVALLEYTRWNASRALVARSAAPALRFVSPRDMHTSPYLTRQGEGWHI